MLSTPHTHRQPLVLGSQGHDRFLVALHGVRLAGHAVNCTVHRAEVAAAQLPICFVFPPVIGDRVRDGVRYCLLYVTYERPVSMSPAHA